MQFITRSYCAAISNSGLDNSYPSFISQCSHCTFKHIHTFTHMDRHISFYCRSPSLSLSLFSCSCDEKWLKCTNLSVVTSGFGDRGNIISSFYLFHSFCFALPLSLFSFTQINKRKRITSHPIHWLTSMWVTFNWLKNTLVISTLAAKHQWRPIPKLVHIGFVGWQNDSFRLTYKKAVNIHWRLFEKRKKNVNKDKNSNKLPLQLLLQETLKM